MYLPPAKAREDATAILEAAFHATIACEPIEKKLRAAVKTGTLTPRAGLDTALLARDQGVISAEEYARWQDKETLRKAVIQVDDFPQDFGRGEIMARHAAETTRVAVRAA
jgi:acyl-CoA dehydrogenase